MNLTQAEFSEDDECKKSWAAELDQIDQDWIDSLDRLTKTKQNSYDLIPYAINDFRTYICQLKAVCYDVKSSISEPETINIIGCTQRETQALQTCQGGDFNYINEHVELCNKEITRKIAIEKVFLRAMMHRDAYHKKTAFMVYRHQILLKKIHDDLFEHIRLLIGYFTEFTERAKCYIKQCDRGPGTETL